MKITRLTLWQVALTSHVPYYMTEGKTCDTVTSTILRIDTDANISGWGEVCPIPGYLPAYAAGVVPAVGELVPALLGAEPVGVDALLTRLERRLRGHVYAKSIIDIALWDITAKAARLPLYALLGGRQSDSLPLYHSVTCIAPEEMARIAKDAYASGIRQIQVKLGADDNVQADIARMRLIREAVGNEVLVYGDFNCGVSRLHAIRVGRAIAGGDFMIEQPCTTLADCAAVRAATGLAMKIDENAHDTESLLQAHTLGCMDAVAVKLSKFGGISAARRARDLCLYLGAKMCIEDVWGSDIVTMAALHLAHATTPAAVLNVCDLSAYVAPRLAPAAPTRCGGQIAVTDAIGLGVTPNVDCLGDSVAVYQ